MKGPTVKTDHYEELSKGDGEALYSYKGLPILATGGTHEYAANTIAGLLPAGASILELGAGSGALSLRLAEAGFEVTAVDYVAANYQARHEKIDFHALDLNGDFLADQEASYDAVVAVEIIEHLENPRHLVRQAFRLLRPGGTLLVTTPNINNPASLATFIWTGRFALFLPRHYEKDGHINPVPWFVMEDALKEAGFENISVSSFKSGVRSIKGLLGFVVQCLGWRNKGPKGQKLAALATRPPALSASGVPRPRA